MNCSDIVTVTPLIYHYILSAVLVDDNILYMSNHSFIVNLNVAYLNVAYLISRDS